MREGRLEMESKQIKLRRVSIDITFTPISDDNVMKTINDPIIIIDPIKKTKDEDIGD